MFWAQPDTPNFSLGIGRNAVHLKTEFTAIVDGTNGDTLLEPSKLRSGSRKLRLAAVSSSPGIEKDGRFSLMPAPIPLASKTCCVWR